MIPCSCSSQEIERLNPSVLLDNVYIKHPVTLEQVATYDMLGCVVQSVMCL